MMFNMAEYELNETIERKDAIIHNLKVCGEKIGPLGFGFLENKWENRTYVYPYVHEQRAISYILDCRNMEKPRRWVDIKRDLEKNGWKPKKGGDIWSPNSIKTLYKNHKDKERDPIEYGISCQGLEIYEKYKVPLVVPKKDIITNIDPETGEFNYLKYFGYMYGERALHIPTLSKMKEDLDSGRIMTGDKLKQDIRNAVNNGVDANGEAIKESSFNIFDQDPDKIQKFFALFGYITNKNEMEEKARIFFS